MLQQSENICCNIMYSYIWHWNHLSLFFIKTAGLYFSVKLYEYIDWKSKEPICLYCLALQSNPYKNTGVRSKKNIYVPGKKK